jgi:hypothetical protein
LVIPAGAYVDVGVVGARRVNVDDDLVGAWQRNREILAVFDPLEPSESGVRAPRTWWSAAALWGSRMFP